MSFLNSQAFLEKGKQNKTKLLKQMQSVKTVLFKEEPFQFDLAVNYSGLRVKGSFNKLIIDLVGLNSDVY